MAVVDDEHFKMFAGVLEREIARCGETEDWFARQKKQIESLIALEVRFRAHLVRSPKLGPYYYRRFIEFICDEQKNILDARPFFRERQAVFARDISKAFRTRNHKALYKFGINYRFIMFVMAQPSGWRRVGKLRELADQITKLRQEIVVMNAPLAINRAQLFYSRTPKSHLARMDLVGIGIEGLMSGIDKYAPDKKGVVTKQFRSTAIGRMGGNFIEDYSETLVHFYPVDKRKIYRANKIIGRNVGSVDFDKLAAGVNEVVKKDSKKDEEVKETEHPTTPDEIADLMAAASTVSSDSSLPSDPDAPEPIERFAAPEASRPDVQVEHHDALVSMYAALPGLSVFQKKVLRLKGIRTRF